MIKAVSAGFLVLLLGACQHYEEYKTTKEPIQPIVTSSDVSTNIEYDYQKCVIKEDQKEKLRNFVMAHQIDRSDELSVAYADIDPELAQKRIRTLSKALADLGLSATFYPVRVFENPQSLRLSLKRYQVYVPNCPNWSQHPGRDYNNETPPNFGCSTASNLALMIGNPRDLIEAQPVTHPDPTIMVNSITTYHSTRYVSDEFTREGGE